ncbi:hypothetical protein OG563_29155 [Nocardia vinacea]|uniref:Secreted protein n=1 Tax=Nocardia vinacea TaxID=96468 RepID=A0ABZ1YJ81_9NOCA|nr:hypothetical protein [Nocardia vinacea]
MVVSTTGRSVVVVVVVDVVVVTMVEIVEETPDSTSTHGAAEVVAVVVTVGHAETLVSQGRPVVVVEAVGPVVLGQVVVVVVCPVLVAVPDEVTVVAATVVRNGAVVVVVVVVGSTRVVDPAADEATGGGTVVPVTTVTGAGSGDVVTGAAPAYPIRFPDSSPLTASTTTTAAAATTSSTDTSRRCGSRLLRIGPIQMSPRDRMRNGQQRGRTPTAPHLPEPTPRGRPGRERREQYRPLPAPMPSNTVPERATTCTFSS